MKKLAILLLTLTVLGTGLLFAAGQQAEEEAAAQVAPGPYGKYDPPITVTTWRGEFNRTWPEGMSAQDNLWTRAFEEELGIILEYVWTAPGPEMDSKINVAIASGDLPQLMGQLPYDAFYNLARSGQLEPLTDAIEQYSVPHIKDNLFTLYDGITGDIVSYDGEMYGTTFPLQPRPHLLWTRDDWRDALGIENSPQTAQDVVDLAYAIAENDPDGDGEKDTFGLGVGDSVFGGSMPLEGFFAMYGAYPQVWVERDGELVHGSVQPEVMDALGVLSQMYDDRVLDQEFVVKGTWSELLQDLANGKMGMAFSHYWFTNLSQVATIMESHPDATWTAVPLPKAGGGTADMGIPADPRDPTAIRAGFANPEALMKMENLAYKYEVNRETADSQFHMYVDEEGDKYDMYRGVSDFLSGVWDDPRLGLKNALNVQEALRDRDPSDLRGQEKVYYDASVRYLDDGDPSGYQLHGVFSEGGGWPLMYQVVDDGHWFWDGYYGPNTTTMNTAMGDLSSKMLEMYTKIIVGDFPVEAGFADWVDYWNANGGDLITAEVNKWYAMRN